MTDKKVYVYEVDIGGALFRDKVAEAMLMSFLEAHGINPKLIIQGTPLRVYRLPDGSFMLETWPAVDHDTMCGTCPPGCLARKHVAVPLAAPVPAVPGSQIWPDGPIPEIAYPADKLAAATSAYHAALEEMEHQAGFAYHVVQQRRRDLLQAQHLAAQPAPAKEGPTQ